MNQLFTERLQQLHAAQWSKTITGIRRGIERETLRINADGTLSQADHPRALGSTLTHPTITTDFSEALLEFITPATSSIDTTLAQLTDIHRFTARQLGDERMGVSSMPGFIQHQDDIRLAYYGTSNIGRMKTLYRQGLKNRYGSMMQAISGVHFNFSIPQEFWAHYQQLLGHQGELQDFISEQYLHLIRNYKRYAWLIVYLFGASPAMCESFLEGRLSNFKFQHIGKGTIYLPYATSLRMSDLGYTNSAQSTLSVTYNSLDEYIRGLHQAITTPSAEYQAFGVKTDGQYQQLNSNVLQIENEFYSTIRPKRTIQSGERPTCALAKRGVEYIEVRALDVNPFSAVGITAEQMRFLDVFLLYCLLSDSPALSKEQQTITEQNLKRVVAEGRKPTLELKDGEHMRLMQDWAEEIFAELSPLAAWFDVQFESQHYQHDLHQWYLSLLDPSRTLSGKVLGHLQDSQMDHSTFNLQLATLYRQQWLHGDYLFYSQAQFEQMAAQSLTEQQLVEQQDVVDFDQYLQQYFVEKPC